MNSVNPQESEKMAYLEGLLYQSGGTGVHETRTGIPQYNGSPAMLTEWKFEERPREDCGRKDQG